MILGTIQATLILIDATGVLLRGPSGVGKSLAALSAMGRGHGFVADDMVQVFRGQGPTPLGRALEKEPRIEVRGLGVVKAHDLFSESVLPFAPIQLVVNLERYVSRSDAGRIDPEIGVADIFGFPTPQIRLAPPQGTDPGFLVEIAARLFTPSSRVSLEP
jgi:HPr kinase/phosphorylase